eukprot:1970509-Prymnesium_polylepis.1
MPHTSGLPPRWSEECGFTGKWVSSQTAPADMATAPRSTTTVLGRAAVPPASGCSLWGGEVIQACWGTGGKRGGRLREMGGRGHRG